MTTLARKQVKLFEHDNRALDFNELELAAKERENKLDKETTAFIFKDGSAIVFYKGNNFKVVTNYGLSAEHEKLN